MWQAPVVLWYVKTKCTKAEHQLQRASDLVSPVGSPRVKCYIQRVPETSGNSVGRWGNWPMCENQFQMCGLGCENILAPVDAVSASRIAE